MVIDLEKMILFFVSTIVYWSMSIIRILIKFIKLILEKRSTITAEAEYIVNFTESKNIFFESCITIEPTTFIC